MPLWKARSWLWQTPRRKSRHPCVPTPDVPQCPARHPPGNHRHDCQSHIHPLLAWHHGRLCRHQEQERCLQQQCSLTISNATNNARTALDRTRHFVLGCSDLVVAVDHKPLLRLFGDRCLEDIPNPRLRNLKEKTLRYRFRMAYVPGAKNHTSDALSRHPTGLSPQKLHLPDDQASPNPNCPGTSGGTTDTTCAIQVDDGLPQAICGAISSIPISWEQLQTATTADPALQDLMFYIAEGPPSDRQALPATIQAYYPVLADMAIIDDVICQSSLPAHLC